MLFSSIVLLSFLIIFFALLELGQFAANVPFLSGSGSGLVSACWRRIAYGAKKIRVLRSAVWKLFFGHWIDFAYLSCWGVGSVSGAASWERKQARPYPLPVAYRLRINIGKGRGQARINNKGSAAANGCTTT